MIDFENEYKIDSGLRKKYDLVIKRIENNKDKKDALILFEGDEGCGKTNHSVAFLKYIAQATGREFTNEEIKFQVEEMIDKAKITKKKIYCWDEPALKALKRMWWDKTQINLTQLLMMARKNQHLFVFNISDFSKFNEYIIRRAVFMLRIYQRNENESTRRFLYFPKKKLRKLHDDWIRKHRRLYLKYHTLHGTMPNKYILPMIISEDKYEKDKDEAIKSIGEEQGKVKDRYKEEWDKMMLRAVTELKFPITIKSPNDLCVKIWNKPENTMTRIREKARKLGILVEKPAKTYHLAPLLINNRENTENFVETSETSTN